MEDPLSLRPGDRVEPVQIPDHPLPLPGYVVRVEPDVLVIETDHGQLARWPSRYPWVRVDA